MALSATSFSFYNFSHILLAGFSTPISEVGWGQFTFVQGRDGCQTEGTLRRRDAQIRKFFSILIIQCYFCSEMIYKYHNFLIQYYCVFGTKIISGNIKIGYFYIHIQYFIFIFRPHSVWASQMGGGEDRWLLFRGILDFFSDGRIPHPPHRWKPCLAIFLLFQKLSVN